MTIFRCLETLKGTFVRKHMSQSCLGCALEVLSGLCAEILDTDAKISIVGYVDVWRGVKKDDFSIFGDLGGDFCKETYEPKMFGMHIRSVLSGLYAENVDTDPKCRFN